MSIGFSPELVPAVTRDELFRLIAQVDRTPNQELYGYRYVTVSLPDGTERVDFQPLSEFDALFPKDGDVLGHHPWHKEVEHYLFGAFGWLISRRPRMRVWADRPIDFSIGLPGEPSPDLSVFDGVEDPGAEATFDPKGMAKPLLFIEMTSPGTAVNDLQVKLALYQHWGVGCYLIIEHPRGATPARLVGYRNTPQGYVHMERDEHGRLVFPDLDLELTMRDDMPVAFRHSTGEELLDYLTLAEMRREAERRAEDFARQIREANRATRRAELRASVAAEA